ncbi:unnamed protein product [Lactuca saligna]|uniref:DUF4283 domain-containing protein n=1 Tax=Lactuca saligna TaxID=75948 RepID=A0AA36E0S8_LACSI|nr:unnamed protein product [Lactuca saligna]
MIKNLCEVWFGYHKMFAFVPRIHRKESNSYMEPTGVEKKWENLPVSYANAVRGSRKEEPPADSTLLNLGMLCHDEGFDEFIIRYVSGLWVMFEFKSKEACKNFLNNDAVNHWIIEKRKWDKTFVPTDHIVWVDVEGLPLRAWNKNSFRHILAKWGSIAHLDDNIGEDVYKSCVCILTSFLRIISEVIKVSIDGEIFLIRIKEAPGWNPTFVCEFNKNSNNDSVDEFHRFQQDHEGSNVSLSDK